jgi:hypothetical protein
MSKYIIVSGSPRTGTSALCRLLKGSGYNVAGDDFPQMRKILPEDDELTVYLKEKHNKTIKPEETLNPKGFHEIGGVVMKGLRKTLRWQKDMPQDGSVIKIMGVGLLDTDVDLIDKVIFSLRHPFDTAHAQLSLKGSPKDRRPSTTMWKRDVESFLEFKQAFPEIECHISLYEYFAVDQDSWREELGDFLGKKLKPIEKITPRQRIDLNGPNHHKLEAIYNLMVEGKCEMALDLLKRGEELMESREKLMCPRAGLITKSQCDTCWRKKDQSVKKKFNLYKMLSLRSQRRKIDWEEEPCPRECRDEDNPKTVQESIDNNFWVLPVGRQQDLDLLDDGDED